MYEHADAMIYHEHISRLLPSPCSFTHHSAPTETITHRPQAQVDHTLKAHFYFLTAGFKQKVKLMHLARGVHECVVIVGELGITGNTQLFSDGVQVGLMSVTDVEEHAVHWTGMLNELIVCFTFWEIKGFRPKVRILVDPNQ